MFVIRKRCRWFLGEKVCTSRNRGSSIRRARIRWPSRPSVEVILEAVATAGVGLIAVRERAAALLAGPERRARAHEPLAGRGGRRGGRGIQRGVVRRYSRYGSAKRRASEGSSYRTATR